MCVGLGDPFVLLSCMIAAGWHVVCLLVNDVTWPWYNVVGLYWWAQCNLLTKWWASSRGGHRRSAFKLVSTIINQHNFNYSVALSPAQRRQPAAWCLLGLANSNGKEIQIPKLKWRQDYILLYRHMPSNLFWVLIAFGLPNLPCWLMKVRWGWFLLQIKNQEFWN